MSRHLRVMCILLAVFVILVTMGTMNISSTGSQVAVESINSFGDQSVAEGINLSVTVGSFEDRLQWDTSVVFDEDARATTKVSFTPWAQDDRWRLEDPEAAGIQIHVTENDVHNRIIFEREEPEGDFLAEWNELKAVYDAIPLDVITSAYKNEKRLLCLNDYYDYYPLFVEGTLPQTDGKKGVTTVYNLVLDVPRYTGEKEYTQKAIFTDYGYWVEAEKSDNPIKNLARGIKYRLWPEYPQEAYVAVSLGEDEEIWQYECKMGKKRSGVLYGDVSVNKPVVTYSVSEASDTDLYYAVDLRLNYEERPKAETFEEGYGVWRIGYEVVEEKSEKKLQFTEVEPKLIYELDPEERLLEITLSELREELYVFTAKDGTYFMAVVDLATEQEIQKLALAGYDPAAIPQVRYVLQGTNVVIPVLTARRWEDTTSEEQMAVVSVSETGEYELKFVIDKDEDMEEASYQYQRETYWEKATVWERDLISVEVAYKDGKLAMVYALTNSYGNDSGGEESQKPGRFWLSVYDETGVVYAADYQMSQAIAERSKIADLSDICEIRDDVKMEIGWMSIDQ